MFGVILPQESKNTKK